MKNMKLLLAGLDGAMCRMAKALLVLAVCCFAATAFAIEDEPDELNWDTFGGTVTGFTHFRSYCRENADFRKRLMAEKPVVKVVSEPTVVRMTAADFAKAPLKQWHEGDVEGVKCIVLQPGHNSLAVRTGIDIPKEGWYRVWVRYHHTQGSVASFELSLEDGRLAGQADPAVTVVQDAFVWRYDMAEFGRKQNFLPNHRDEPTGWIWEASPMVRLEKGRRAVMLRGLIHDGQYAERRVAEVVLTTDPLAKPGERPSLGEADVRDLWARRPMVGAKPSPELKNLWRIWRKQFVADLADGRLAGVEAGRMAGTVYFDEDANMIGTPKQVAEAQAGMVKLLAGVDRTHFKRKVECEDFQVKGYWWVSDGGGSSSGKHLTADWGHYEADAWTDVTVPSNGTYNVWLRNNEVGGYLSGWHFLVEQPEGTAIVDRYMQSDWDHNAKFPGMSWGCSTVKLQKGKVRLRLYKKEGGSTYRHVDAAIVTDDLAYVPDGVGVVLSPLDKEPLTVWRKKDPWVGYSLVDGPREDENLEPCSVDVRDGETATVLVLVRNNTSKRLEITPTVKGDRYGRLSWRVVAFSLSGWGEWTPQQLLCREQVYAPSEQTVGLWISIKGDRRAKKERIRFTVGGHELALDVNRLEPHPGTVPVPYVYGWATPWKTVSNWETFRDLGVNVIGDALVSKAEAARYGIRLTTHLNDDNITPDHVKEVKSRFARLGYEPKDWAWSFMDEPNNSLADRWVDLAKQFRAIDREIPIWVNPGEVFHTSPESCMKMTPHVNYYCPYADHFWNMHLNGAYSDQLRRKGPKFDILMSYMTPCFGEKAASATSDMFALVELALKYDLDGWGFFAFAYGFTYCNSLWDEINNYMADQCVYIYPGVAYRTILTRNAEALREAVQRWRAAKAAAGTGK